MRPTGERRFPALEQPKPQRPVTRAPQPRPQFQYPLYMLIVMMTVIALALAPAGYFFRSAVGDRGNRAVGMVVMLVGPLLTVVLLSTVYRLARYVRGR